VADIVQDGWNGYVVPTGDPGKLSEALQRVVCAPDLNATMGARSAQRIQQNSPQACAAGFVAAMDAAGSAAT
jgi:glycosyltransferase involved in cell wall biosynthesis